MEACSKVAILFHTISRGLAEYLKGEFAGERRPLASMLVLRAIMQEPGITVSQLARQTGLAKSHVSQLVDDLSRRSLVDRRSDKTDQRLLRLHLSEDGDEQFQQMQVFVHKRMKKLVAHIPPEKTALVLEGLQVLLAAVERAKIADNTEC